jgi:hypothetical protein
MKKKNVNTKKKNIIKEIIKDIVSFSFYVISLSYFLIFFLYLSLFFGIDNSFILQKIKDFLLIYMFIILGANLTSHYLELK